MPKSPTVHAHRLAPKSSPTVPARRLVSIQAAAAYYGVSTKTIRRGISSGRIVGYRVPATHLIRVDLTELDAGLTPIPTAAGGHNG